MIKKKIFMTISLLCALAQGAWAQGEFGNLPNTVSAADVKVTAVNDAYFTDEGFVVVSPDEDPEPVLARRRAGGLNNAGSGQLVGAKLYSYTYPSVDADGNVVTLSSLMAVPSKMVVGGVNTNPDNLVIGCHVTITSNYECPTEYNETGGAGSWMTDVGMLIDYTRNDAFRQPCCLVIIPDYEGYGVTKNRAHPYLYQELTARQVVDAVRYGLQLYKDNKTQYDFCDLEENWKSVCIGYSQGGSVALATHRFIEENGLADDLHFAGSVCGDGPYDPVATLKQYIDVNRLYMPVVAPLIIKGMCDANPYVAGKYNINDYLCADFLNSGIADWISEKSINTDKIQERLCEYSANHNSTNKYPVNADDSLFVMYGFATESTGLFSSEDRGFQPITTENNRRYNWRENYGDRYATAGSTLRPEVREYFSGATTTASPAISAIRQALDMNNLTTGWQPQRPMVVFHSKYDEVVPFVNYERARAAFTGPNFHGVTYDTNVQTHVSTGKSFFTLYLSYYVSALRKGKGDTLPRERDITGSW